MIDYLTQWEWDEVKGLVWDVSEIYTSNKEDMLKRDYAYIGERFYDIVQMVNNRDEVDTDIDVLPVSDDAGKKYIAEYREYLKKESEVTIGDSLLKIKIEDINLIVSLDTDKVYLTTGWERTVLTLAEFLEHMVEISRTYPEDDTASITNDWMREIMMEFFSTNIKA